MKLLSSAEEINKKICSGIKKYKKISFAVAWASKNNTASELIFNNIKKLQYCTVGLHFYQTHPDFIEPFIKTGPIKFIKKHKGIFHPKIYLFWNDNKNWISLIGSANLTKSALNDNEETMILINSNDKVLFSSIQSQIKSYYDHASFISEEKFMKYKKICQSKKKDKSNQDNFDEITALNISNLFQLSWDEYYTRLKNTKNFKERLKLLTKANELFQSNQFDKLDELTRKNIAGVTKASKDIADWHLFGRMPVPYFANRISDKDSHKGFKYISKQLEHISLNEEITKEDYKQYLIYFIEHDGFGYSISTVSRLLTMKRPDQFFCLTKANESALLEALNVEHSIQHDNKENMYNRYWNEIIESVRLSPWYKSKEPKSSMEEKMAWHYRTALMDALLYLE